MAFESPRSPFLRSTSIPTFSLEDCITRGALYFLCLPFSCYYPCSFFCSATRRRGASSHSHLKMPLLTFWKDLDAHFSWMLVGELMRLNLARRSNSGIARRRNRLFGLG